jgi:hypothetical protein
MKRAMFIFCGVCWLGFALAIGIISFSYLGGGAVGPAGFVSQIFAPVTSGSVLLGLLHFVGFVALDLVCLAIGLILLLRGLFPEQSPKRNPNPPKK